MLDEDLLECCQSILDFLCEDDKGLVISPSEWPTPKQKIMDEVLTRNYWKQNKNFYERVTITEPNMTGFTKYLNDTFQMGYEIQDEDGNYKKFFSSEQSRNFYRHFVRHLKLKQLI